MQNEFNEALDKNLVNYTNSVESSPKMDIINDEENTRDMDLKNSNTNKWIYFRAFCSKYTKREQY